MDTDKRNFREATLDDLKLNYKFEVENGFVTEELVWLLHHLISKQ